MASLILFTGHARLRELLFFFFQAEDGIRDLVRSRGLGDVYKRQTIKHGRVELACVVPRQIARPFSAATNFLDVV